MRIVIEGPILTEKQFFRVPQQWYKNHIIVKS